MIQGDVYTNNIDGSLAIVLIADSVSVYFDTKPPTSEDWLFLGKRRYCIYNQLPRKTFSNTYKFKHHASIDVSNKARHQLDLKSRLVIPRGNLTGSANSKTNLPYQMIIYFFKNKVYLKKYGKIEATSPDDKLNLKLIAKAVFSIKSQNQLEGPLVLDRLGMGAGGIPSFVVKELNSEYTPK